MLLRLLARARARVSPPGGRVAHHSADPVPGALGAFALHRAGAGPVATRPTAEWDTDPATGEPLPAGAHLQLASDAFREARIAHRHGWFPALAFVKDPAAVDLLDSWLRHDIPGTGLAWAHPSDLAVRLCHWHAGLSWMSLPDPLVAALSGSARWHCEHLAERMPVGSADGARRVAHFAGMVVGGLTFPAVPDARRSWSEGLAGLRFTLPELLFPDGAPRDDAPLRLAETLWFVTIARAVARANGVGFPAAAEGALARGAGFLERLTGELGALPPVGEAPLGDLLPGSPEARRAWLGEPTVEPESAGKTWAMWSYREAGTAVAWMRIKGRASRVVASMGTPSVVTPFTHVAPLQVLWDVGEVTVLADPGPGVRAPAAHGALLLDGHALPAPPPATLDVARVDGKKARIEGHHDGWARFGVPLTHHRDILLNQQRLVITDRLVPRGKRVGRHAVHLAWPLGAGWTLTPEGPGYLAKNGDLTLVIQLPKGLAWTLQDGHLLVGDGGVEGEAEFVTSFEVR